LGLTNCANVDRSMVGAVPTVLWRCESNKVFLKAGSEAFLLIHAMGQMY